MAAKESNISTTLLFALLAVTIVGALVYAIVESNKNPRGLGGLASGVRPGPGSGINKNKLLKVGVKGNEVRALQNALNSRTPNMADIAVDGDFGPQTEARLFVVAGVQQVTLNELYAMGNSIASNSGIAPPTLASVAPATSVAAPLLVARPTNRGGGNGGPIPLVFVKGTNDLVTGSVAV